MPQKILIIDDDPDLVLAARMPLEKAGFEVHEASNSDEGLVAVDKVKPDLILLDVMMDTHTAGFQLALTLHGPDAKPEHKHIPIIILTAVHQTTPLRFGPDEEFLPVQAFLEKPLKPQALLDEVSKQLQSD